MDNQYCVYMHVNKINGKKYIGITKDPLEKRWGLNGSQYLCDNRGHFSKALKKYGWDNFEHLVLFEGISQEEACNKEIELIALHKTQDPNYGYNVQPGGQLGNYGVVFPEETRKKMSLAKKGKKRNLTEEQHKAISEKLRGRKAAKKTPEGLQRLREANLGKTMSKETREKISKKLKGIKKSPETLSKRKEHRKDLVKVYCPELNIEFPSLCDASRDTSVPRANIQKCLRGERHSAGKHPETNEKLHWIKVE